MTRQRGSDLQKLSALARRALTRSGSSTPERRAGATESEVAKLPGVGPQSDRCATQPEDGFWRRAAVADEFRGGMTAVTRAPAGFAWGSLLVAGCVFAVLVAFGGRYGYHRDELYFLVAGRHVAWGYPDQPPFVALVARVMSDLAPGSVTVLRLPSALATAAIVPLTAALTRQFCGEHGAQLLAAASIGVSLILLGAGHTLSTTTFDLLAWVLISLLVVVILRREDERLWLGVGLLAGAGVARR